MSNLVAYDSYFGNTEQVARAVAETLEAEVIHVNDVVVASLNNLELFVLGSPTRAFKASDATRALLGRMKKGDLDGVRVAAFDTRMDVKKVGNPILSIMERFFGYAAEPMAKKLVEIGGSQAGEPGGFIVEESEGPLRDGELERAREWADGLR